MPHTLQILLLQKTGVREEDRVGMGKEVGTKKEGCTLSP